MSKIVVIIEYSKGVITSSTKETITVAKKLSQELMVDIEGIIFGDDVDTLATEAIKYGIKTVYKVEGSPFAGINVLYHTRTLEALIKQQGEKMIILAGASLYGQEVIPRLAARFNKAIFASVKNLLIKENKFEGIHPLFEEKLFATMHSDKDQLTFATILSGNNPEAELDESNTGNVVVFTPTLEETDNREVFLEEKVAKISVDITKAKLIVAGGRGVGSKEKFGVIHETAKALGGEVGASRAAVDADWVAYDHEIGQTGKTVSPDFYIAAGISGAIQHLVGMRNSKTIIAINTDEEAPILEVAHYAIIADLHQILPELVKKF